MSIQSARKAAEKLVVSLEIQKLPVNVYEVARELRLPVMSAKLDDGVSGMLLTPPVGTSQIVVNSTDHEHRRRFTVAHEIGHHVLGHQFSEHVHVDRGFKVLLRSNASHAPIEVDANAFAASLLMPESLLREELAHLDSVALSDEDVDTLAKLFDVSPQAMALRLSGLRTL